MLPSENALDLLSGEPFHPNGVGMSGCVFCGRRGAMSKEHIWPRWVGRTISADLPSSRSVRTVEVRSEGDEAIIEPTRWGPEQQGSVLATKVRIVCQTCNNGWMSRLEANCRRLIRLLLDPGLALINPADCASLATWAIKTAWMNEFVGGGTGSTSTVGMRASLMNKALPPASCAVWLARHKGDLRLDIRHARLALGHQDDPAGLLGVRHAQRTSIVLDQVALLAWSADGPGVPTPQPPSERWAVLWPTAESVWWGGLPEVSDEEVVRGMATFAPSLRLREHNLVRRRDLGPDVTMPS